MMPRDQRYGTHLFRDLRQDNNGLKTPDFSLIKKSLPERKLLWLVVTLAAALQGEGAVFTLVDSGFRSVIAPSFLWRYFLQ